MPGKFRNLIAANSKTFHGTFNNHRKRHDHLQGKTALLHNHIDTRSVLAQFDDTSLSEAFGWWEFERADFSNVRELGKQEIDNHAQINPASSGVRS